MSTRSAACCAVLIGAAAWISTMPAIANEGAQAIAEKFSGETERSAAAKAEDARKREAELKADADRKAAAARRAEDMRKADEAKARAKAKQAQGARREPQKNPAEEADMLARARREAEELQATEEARILAEQDAAMARAQAELRASQAAEEARTRAEATARAVVRGRQTATEAVKSEAEAGKLDPEADRIQLEMLARKAAEEVTERDAVVTQRAREAAERRTREVAEEARTRAEAEAAERAFAEWMGRANATQRVIRDMSRVRAIRATRLAQADRARKLAALERKTVAEAPVSGSARDGKPVETAASGHANGPAGLGGKGANASGTVELGTPLDPGTADLQRRQAVADPGLRERVVTVLVVMAPGTYGIRRSGPKVADPVLCTHEGCYISNGGDYPAELRPIRKVLGFGNTFGARAGACRQRLGCIFRGVEVGPDAVLQPVDMHILKHDRRMPQTIRSDSGCRIEGGSITCSRGIYADTYVMWVIPESMARAVGGAGLERTLEEGLALPRSADLDPRMMRR